MEESKTFTLRVSLAPQYKNNLIGLGFKKQKNIARHIRCEDSDDLIKYTKTIDKNPDLSNDLELAYRYMNEIALDAFSSKPILSNRFQIGYRLLGYYDCVELSKKYDEKIRIWIK